jgi:hypothetical protein
MRYIIGFLITIGLIILLVVSLVGGGNNGKQKVPETSKPLESYSNTDVLARLTIGGPITAPQNYDEIRITVGKASTTYEHIVGFDGAVKESRSYPMTPNAYNNFLHALSVVGFTQGNTSSDLRDERGQCPQENRYVYELIDGSSDIVRFWSTDCGKPSTYQGAPQATNDLFRAQVPDYGNLTENISMAQ